MQHIAILASGGGSNAQKIIEHFSGHSSIKVVIIISNKKNSGVLTISKKHNIPSHIIDSKVQLSSVEFIALLEKNQIDLIVLAGFLLKIPEELIHQYPNKIINIHPSLLPKFGGKGMYGLHVHNAVIKGKEKQSGITIHYVNNKYDEGGIIFQEACILSKEETPETLQKKVLVLEHKNYAKVIERLLSR